MSGGSVTGQIDRALMPPPLADPAERPGGAGVSQLFNIAIGAALVGPRAGLVLIDLVKAAYEKR